MIALMVAVLAWIEVVWFKGCRCPYSEYRIL